MILNFHIGMQDVAPTTPQDAKPPVGLFRMGEATSGEGERWAWAVLAAALVHAGLVILGLTLPHGEPKAATLPEEPEVVFFSFPPPPPAASSAAHSAAPEPVKRQARTRAPRVVPALAMKKPVPEPVETPVETTNPETVQDTPPEPEETPATEAVGSPGVEGVVAGIVGGALGGREGGLPGATGGSALELKQVARAPEVLAQVKPRYPRRAKADGIQGLVLVRIIIGTDGHVEPGSARIVRSVPELDEAAISAVSQWRFSPAFGHHGRPVRVIVEIPVQFSLK